MRWVKDSERKDCSLCFKPFTSSRRRVKIRRQTAKHTRSNEFFTFSRLACSTIAEYAEIYSVESAAVTGVNSHLNTASRSHSACAKPAATNSPSRRSRSVRKHHSNDHAHAALHIALCSNHRFDNVRGNCACCSILPSRQSVLDAQTNRYSQNTFTAKGSLACAHTCMLDTCADLDDASSVGFALRIAEQLCCVPA